ncbi:MAG: hypothetical protein A3C02_02495 [Candidatus Andersenbacteria bacterium RIFCSPHIGHO2_02_FULL_45_11]|uniref:Uncharacterized protein n=1 Tax=Candidatus Andersenbacteria bacterium RIFCSPHIGHO2_12_FULL_45_11 TaxID=1797281 RepID=A0A1G1X0Z1_9BACT|nr:MAG: hypothetical protein A2805_00360 [Candidatus Andersenbacteria bacterium RIFCSPHIGHO2_01_FULL_46_36]OGY32417.1 MAG: hypothetical protein A3C02_02495 [Candidatus Andersenbacteria bacterium RIFCSPHIGHO2_02_FULL_45_11]OGY33676.1 MAG: hypothetical protein A3D99_00135 [Candidatus Andersenbacteria bacterium RIFCSPHIGHO2_12_FULL_45_11]
MVDFNRDQAVDPSDKLDQALQTLVGDIFDGTMAEPDPHHTLEYLQASNEEWLAKNHGTSFVFFPCTSCFIHKVPEPEGRKIRHTILTNLSTRLIHTLKEKSVQFEEIRYDFFHQGVNGFNNGEIYLWLHNATVNDETACEIMMAMRKLIDEEPIMITYFGKQYEMKFYGQGFRQL